MQAQSCVILKFPTLVKLEGILTCCTIDSTKNYTFRSHICWRWVRNFDLEDIIIWYFLATTHYDAFHSREQHNRYRVEQKSPLVSSNRMLKSGMIQKLIKWSLLLVHWAQTLADFLEKLWKNNHPIWISYSLVFS